MVTQLPTVGVSTASHAHPHVTHVTPDRALHALKEAGGQRDTWIALPPVTGPALGGGWALVGNH